MAKSTPQNYYIDKKGRKIGVIGWDKGTTEVYVLGSDGEKIPNAKYDWYAFQMYVKCFKNSSGKTSVLLIRGHGWSQGLQANDNALAYAFYVDGKLMNRYSTLDLALFPENVEHSVSHYMFLQKILGIHEPLLWGQDVFQVITLDGRTVSFDLPSGNVTSQLKNNVLQKALFDAVGQGDISGIKKALKRGAKLNDWYRDGYARPFGWTSLRYALHKKQEAVARFLIDQGADVNAKTFDGIYIVPKEELQKKYKPEPDVLHYSVFHRNYDRPQWVEPTAQVIKNVSMDETHIQHEGHTLLYDMVSADSVTYVKLLLEAGADPNRESDNGNTPLHFAVRRKNLKLAKVLLQNGADPNRLTHYLSEAPLHEAVSARSPEMIELLVDHGAELNLHREGSVVGAPLHEAASIDQLETVKALIKRGADLYAQEGLLGFTPVHEATATTWGNKVFLYFIKSGVKLNVRSKYLDTPLHVAVGWGKDDRVKLLLENGADVNAVNKRKKTPLLVAVDKKRWHWIKPLVEKGADCQIKSGGDWTVLHYAVVGRAPQWVFEYFIKQGVNINVRNKQGNTPLHIAVDYDRLDELKLLLKLGADPNVQNKQGQPPRSFAVEHNKNDFIKLFDEAAGGSQ